MRQFWGNQLDYNDRNDFPAGNRNNPGNPRPTGALVNEFAFGDVTGTGTSMDDLGRFLTRVTDGGGLPRFGISVVQQLCFYANSPACSTLDPEFRRIVASFRDKQFNFAVLLKEFFSSPLVTGASATGSYPAGEVPISISRRDHLCASLSNRLGKPDLCAQATVLPTQHADRDGTHRVQRRFGRVQPRRRIAGDAGGPDAVLPRRHRAAVREHRHPGRRRDDRRRCTRAPTCRGRSPAWCRR